MSKIRKKMYKVYMLCIKKIWKAISQQVTPSFGQGLGRRGARVGEAFSMHLDILQF